MDSIEKNDSVKQKKGLIAVDLIETNQKTSAGNNEGKKECASNKGMEGNGRNCLQIFKKKGRGSKGKVEVENCKIEPESLWEKFARTTTGHGFARMVDKNEPLKFRIFWAVAVIFLTVGLFTSVFIVSYDSLVVKGLRREFIIQHNSSLDLPDIHICDTSLFNVTILKGRFLII